MTLREIVGRARDWIIGLWPRSIAPAATDPLYRDLGCAEAAAEWIERVAPVLPTPTAPKVRRQREPLHITDILNLLPKCREMLPALRTVEPAVADFWRVMGARILSDNIGGYYQPFGNYRKEELPGTGMLFMCPEPKDEDDDVFPGLFVHFERARKTPLYTVVPAGSDVMYRIVIGFADHGKKAVAYDYHVSVSRDGAPEVVAQRSQYLQHLPKTGKSYKRNEAGFYRTDWGVPDMLRYHYREARRRNRLEKSIDDPMSFGVHIFRVAVALHNKASEDFQVRAERDGVSVAFNVALGRTPQFFKDRQTELATDGKRKRIFHAVVEHERVLASGHVSMVRAHYRGERSFLWKGEAITITPSERSFARTFMVETETTEEGASIPPDKIDVVAAAPRLRRIPEAEWRR